MMSVEIPICRSISATACVRGVDVEEGVMRAAVLLDLVGGGLETPIFGLGDLAAQLFDDGLVSIHKRCHLLRRDVLARKKGMLVKWHIGLSLVAVCPEQSPRQALERH